MPQHSKPADCRQNAEIRDVRNLVDWKHVELAADFVRLHGAGTKITLNGIAQGFRC